MDDNTNIEQTERELEIDANIAKLMEVVHFEDYDEQMKGHPVVRAVACLPKELQQQIIGEQKFFAQHADMSSISRRAGFIWSWREGGQFRNVLVYQSSWVEPIMIAINKINGITGKEERYTIELRNYRHAYNIGDSCLKIGSVMQGIPSEGSHYNYNIVIDAVCESLELTDEQKVSIGRGLSEYGETLLSAAEMIFQGGRLLEKASNISVDL